MPWILIILFLESIVQGALPRRFLKDISLFQGGFSSVPTYGKTVTSYWGPGGEIALGYGLGSWESWLVGSHMPFSSSYRWNHFSSRLSTLGLGLGWRAKEGAWIRTQLGKAFLKDLESAGMVECLLGHSQRLDRKHAFHLGLAVSQFFFPQETFTAIKLSLGFTFMK